MTVTTQLIGKLGGGAPEMQETVISFSNIAKSCYVPSGWKKALATFSGTASSPSPIIFGQWLNGLMPGTSCNGGGRHRHNSFPGCLRHDYVGAPGITHGVVVTNGCHHTTHRQTRRRTGLEAVGLRQFSGARTCRAESHVATRSTLVRSVGQRDFFAIRVWDNVYTAPQRRICRRPKGRENGRIPKLRLAHLVVVA